MTKLLSDIDISRSVAVASFLELEAAARFCMYLSTSSSVLKKMFSVVLYVCLYVCRQNHILVWGYLIKISISFSINF
jgi:hypothetical protein